jgi:hypothetical protein
MKFGLGVQQVIILAMVLASFGISHTLKARLYNGLGSGKLGIKF